MTLAPVTKQRRHGLILELLRARPIHRQEEIAAHLTAAGVPVAQSTLSRDLRELGVVKSATGYHLPEEGRRGEGGSAEEPLARMLHDFLRGVVQAGTLLVLKTRPGHAPAVGAALDHAGWKELAGTVAGDDTVFAAAHSIPLARRALRRLQRLWR